MIARLHTTIRSVLPAVLITALVWGCATTPAHQPPVLGDHTTRLISLEFPPSYITLLGSPSAPVLYIEGETGGERLAAMIQLAADGSQQSAIRPLLEGFTEALDQALTTPDGGLLLSMMRTLSDDLSLYELWHWSGAGTPSHLLHCELPASAHDRVLLIDPLRIIVLFEDRTGALLGFQTPLEAPSCPDANSLVRLLDPPLPGGYLASNLVTGFAVAGAMGGSYTVDTFDARLGLNRHFRIAASAATDARDFELFSLPHIGDVALFGAHDHGSHDLYLAPLPSPFSAAPPEARRVIATGETERLPHLFDRGFQQIISWSVITASGTRLRLATPLAATGAPTPRGGEVLWRRTSDTPASWLWTDQGFLSAEVTGGTNEWAVSISLYRPTFW